MFGGESNLPLWLRLLLRSIPAAAVTFYLVGRVTEGMQNPSYGLAFIIAGTVAAIGAVWAIAIGFPLIARFGEKCGQLYVPSDSNFRVRPEFSIAEAHAKAGRYTEAIAQFRRDIEQFTDEPMPHIRIADLLVQEFHDVPAAMTELEAALLKTRSADAFVLVSNRLADLALWQYKDGGQKAAEYIRAIEHRYPGSRHAKAATERIAGIFSRDR